MDGWGGNEEREREGDLLGRANSEGQRQLRGMTMFVAGRWVLIMEGEHMQN